MKLLTTEIIKKIEKYPLYSQDGKGGAAKIIVKFFSIVGDMRWYVTEGEKLANSDYRFFGLVTNHGEREYGYFMLSDLQIKRGGLQLVERDLYFKNKTISDVE